MHLMVQDCCTLVKDNMQFCLKNFRSNLKELRKSLGLTQDELAKKLDGKKSLISNYENGHSTPDIIMLCKLADIFDISLDEFIGRDFH